MSSSPKHRNEPTATITLGQTRVPLSTALAEQSECAPAARPRIPSPGPPGRAWERASSQGGRGQRASPVLGQGVEAGGRVSGDRAQVRNLRPRAILRPAVLLGAIVGAARAQVRNLRFDDTDSAAGRVGGIAYWEEPQAGVSGISAYAVYLSTNSSSGGTETQVGSDVRVGAWTSELAITETSIPTGAQFLLVYMKDAGGNLNTGTVAHTCLKDLQNSSPSGYARMVYFTTKGYANAHAAKDLLSKDPVCAVQAHRIEIKMVATAYYNATTVPAPTSPDVATFDDNPGQEESCTTTSDCTGTHECTAGICQSSSAAFLVSFPTGSDFTATINELDAAGYLTDAPIPAFYTGEGTNASGFSMGLIEVSSVMDAFVPVRPDTDIAEYLARSVVDSKVALAALVDRLGFVHILTMTSKTAAVDQVANVWIGYRSATFVDMDASVATKSYFSPYVSSTAQAQCWQITSNLSHPSCT